MGDRQDTPHDAARISEDGPPLGFGRLVSNQEVHSIDLRAEDGVLVVTDGMFEGFTAPGSRERVGFDGFVELLQHEHLAVENPDVLNVLADRLEQMNGGALLDDAAALLILRRCDT